MKKIFAASAVFIFFALSLFAENSPPPLSIYEIPTAEDWVLKDNVTALPAEDPRVEAQLIKNYEAEISAKDAADFYLRLFSSYITPTRETPDYEDAVTGEISKITYFADTYAAEDFVNGYDGKKLTYNGKNVRKCLKKLTGSPETALKSATFSWGEKTAKGWRTFFVEIYDESFNDKGEGCALKSVIKIYEIKYKTSDEQAAEAEAAIKFLYEEKKKEFENYSGASAFLGAPKYPGSAFLIDRSAAMTAENFGKDTFIFSVGDPAEKVAAYYAALPEARAISSDDNISLFILKREGTTVTIAVGAAEREGSDEIFTEITLLEGENS